MCFNPTPAEPTRWATGTTTDPRSADRLVGLVSSYGANGRHAPIYVRPLLVRDIMDRVTATCRSSRRQTHSTSYLYSSSQIHTTQVSDSAHSGWRVYATRTRRGGRGIGRGTSGEASLARGCGPGLLPKVYFYLNRSLFQACMEFLPAFSGNANCYSLGFKQISNKG
jgi:hypothetical protein